MGLQVQGEAISKKYQASFVGAYQIATEVGADRKVEIAASKDGDMLFPAASIIKLPIYLYYYERAVRNELDLQQVVEVAANNRVDGSGVLHILTSKTSWTLEELLQLMIAVSDNEATNQLIKFVGLDTLQAWIKTKSWQAGIHLRRYLMDYASGLVNEVSAAGAIAVLQEIIVLGQRYPKWQKRIEKPLLLQQHRTCLPGALTENEIPNLEMLNKTGEDNGIRHDVALFRYQGKEMYVAALTQKIQSEAAATAWMQELGQLVYTELRREAVL